MKARFPYQSRNATADPTALMPLLPLVLSRGQQSEEVLALVDTGATTNVLPYDVGERLGAVWKEQTTVLSLAGNLASYEARGLILTATCGPFQPVRFAFAWTTARDVPIILGQVNFLMEFEACFFRQELAFELTKRS